MPTMVDEIMRRHSEVQLLPCTEFPKGPLLRPAGGAGASCVQSRRRRPFCDEHHQPPRTTKDKQFDQCRSQFTCSYGVCVNPCLGLD